jgi:hypothetical protein
MGLRNGMWTITQRHFRSLRPSIVKGGDCRDKFIYYYCISNIKLKEWVIKWRQEIDR